MWFASFPSCHVIPSYFPALSRKRNLQIDKTGTHCFPNYCTSHKYGRLFWHKVFMAVCCDKPLMCKSTKLSNLQYHRPWVNNCSTSWFRYCLSKKIWAKRVSVKVSGVWAMGNLQMIWQRKRRVNNKPWNVRPKESGWEKTFPSLKELQQGTTRKCLKVSGSMMHPGLLDVWRYRWQRSKRQRQDPHWGKHSRTAWKLNSQQLYSLMSDD